MLMTAIFTQYFNFIPQLQLPFSSSSGFKHKDLEKMGMEHHHAKTC